MITRGTRQCDNVSPKTFIGHLERVMDKNKERGKEHLVQHSCAHFVLKFLKNLASRFSMIYDDS